VDIDDASDGHRDGDRGEGANLGRFTQQYRGDDQHEQSDAFHTYPPFSVSGNGAVKSQVQELRGALDRGVPRVDADAAYVYERH
jgi:hypothetical protein